MPKDKTITPLLGLLVFFLLVLGAEIANYNLRYKDSAFPKIYLNSQSYAGISKADAKASLEKQIEKTYGGKMKFIYEDKVYEIALSDLGIRIDEDGTLGNVFSYGHRQNVLDSAKEQMNLLKNDVNFQNKLSEGDSLIEESQWKEIAKIETAGKDFSYKWNGKEFTPVAAENGSAINKNKLKKDIEENLANLQNNPVQIELVPNKPVLEKDADGQALADAQNLIEKEIILKYSTASWKIAKDDLGHWIGFSTKTGEDGVPMLVLSPNTANIKDYLASLAPQINREPVNAQLEFKNGKVGVFTLSQDGLQIDMDASVNKISAEIFRADNYSGKTGVQTANAAPASGQISVELAVNTVKPELTNENIDNMGISSLLATGESNFSGSTASRKHNITVGAGKFQGVLIGPGDTFSFDKILGNVGAKEGYLPEYVIKKGQTIPEYGGGLCQVSTTAFRGAVKAGLEVTQRTNHAYAVKYYDPQGTDATIYPPSPDLVFINNTPAYILIQTRISGNNLYFDFYGTNDGRKVVTEGPVVYERGTGGAMKTWWKQSVYDKDGKLFLEKTFYSNYKSPALYPHTNPLE